MSEGYEIRQLSRRSRVPAILAWPAVFACLLLAQLSPWFYLAVPPVGFWAVRRTSICRPCPLCHRPLAHGHADRLRDDEPYAIYLDCHRCRVSWDEGVREFEI